MSERWLIDSPLQGTVVSCMVSAGDTVGQEQTLVILESMKMEHHVVASVDATVIAVHVHTGDSVMPGQVLVELEGGASAPVVRPETPAGASAADRDVLVELYARRRLLEDSARPEAVARRHATGRRTARENIKDLCDADMTLILSNTASTSTFP